MARLENRQNPVSNYKSARARTARTMDELFGKGSWSVRRWYKEEGEGWRTYHFLLRSDSRGPRYDYWMTYGGRNDWCFHELDRELWIERIIQRNGTGTRIRRAI